MERNDWRVRVVVSEVPKEEQYRCFCMKTRMSTENEVNSLQNISILGKSCLELPLFSVHFQTKDWDHKVH